jgi:asparagine synthase (glutamine-hydrolysing)
VRVVPPAASFKWSEGRLAVSGGYRWGKRQTVSRAEAIEGLVCLFRSAIAKRAPDSDDYVVPLSGGRDSRHILLELCVQGHRDPACVTCRLPHSEDWQVATTLARRLGVRHTIADPPSSVAAERRKNLKTHFGSLEHCWYLGVAEHVKPTDIVYDGLAGDVLTDIRGEGHRTVDTSRLLEEGRLSELASQMLKGLGRTFDTILTSTLVAADTQIEAAQMLEQELQRHAVAPNPVASFVFWNRTRRGVATMPYGILAGIRRVYTPFLDHELFDFITSMTWRSLADNQWHTQAISSAYPEFSAFPYSAEMVREPYSQARQFAKELLPASMRCVLRSAPVTRRLRIATLLLACSIGDGLGARFGWVLPRLAYLMQLEDLLAASSPA